MRTTSTPDLTAVCKKLLLLLSMQINGGSLGKTNFELSDRYISDYHEFDQSINYVVVQELQDKCTS